MIVSYFRLSTRLTYDSGGLLAGAVKPVIQFMPHKYKGTQFDTFIWHCCRAKITLELLKDIVLFDIEAALSWMADHDTSIRGANFWKEVLHWINFVIWLQEQVRISKLPFNVPRLRLIFVFRHLQRIRT